MRRAALIVVGCTMSACGASKPAPCDVAQLDRVLSQIDSAGSSASAITAAVLSESCAARMPPPLKEVLDEIAGAGEWRLAAVAKGLAGLMVEARDLFPAACDKSAQQMARDFQILAQSGEGMPLCEVGARALGVRSRGDPEHEVQIVVAALTQAWLTREGLDARRARVLGHGLADSRPARPE